MMQQSNHIIVSTTAYLLGVHECFFSSSDVKKRDLYREVYDDLQQKTPANILRHLCILRTQFEKNFRHINSKMHEILSKSLDALTDYISAESLYALRNAGITIKNQNRAVDYVIELNRLIMERVGNCKGLYPNWIEWKYISELFIMPNGLTVSGTQAEATKYYNHKDSYPYQMYMNWQPKECGNILASDMAFVPLLYSWHKEKFTHYEKLTKLPDDTRENIKEFLKKGQDTVIVVDCENVDPYLLYGALTDLDDYLDCVTKIILYNDSKANISWKYIKEDLDIPVEYIETKRLLDRKSLVDQQLTLGTCREYYENNIRSFILASSDSDFWPMIQGFADADFMLLLQREQCSPVLQGALAEEGICHCFIEDFPSEQANELKDNMILRQIKTNLNERLKLNLGEMIKDAASYLGTNMTDSELTSYTSKVAKNLRFEVGKDWELSVAVNEETKWK